MLILEETLVGHSNPVYALSSAADPDRFYSAGNDKGVVEWSLSSMTYVKILLPVQSSVYALHRFNNLLFIGQRSGTILVFNTTTEQLLARLDHHKKGVFDIKTIPSKNELISTGEEGNVVIWSLSDFSLLYEFPVINNTLRVVELSKDEKIIAIGAKDGLIRLYNAEDYALIKILEGHTLPITSIQFDPPGTYMISGSRDAQLKVWSLLDFELQKNIPAHLFSIYSIVFHPTLPYFASCSQDKSIKLWSSNDFRLVKILSNEKNTGGHFHSINHMIWSADGKYLISTGDDRHIMIWRLENA
jgi:WD40 repeat protein